MKTAAAAIVIVFAALSGSAADDTVYQKFLEAGKKQKATDEAAIKERLGHEKTKEAAIKRARPNARDKTPSFSTGRDKSGKTTWTFNYFNPKDKAKALKDTQDRIKEYESALVAMKDVEFVTPKLYPLELKVGDVGIVWVVNANPGPVKFEAFQVIDENNVIAKFSGQLHWLKTNTKGMVDGKLYALDQIVHVKGTRTYKAAIGTKTVLELEDYTPPKKGEKK